MAKVARHLSGFVYGVAAVPVAAMGLSYGSVMAAQGNVMSGVGRADILAVGALGMAAVVLGIAVGSRLSPLASLIPGLVYGSFGVLWVLGPTWSTQNLTWWPKNWPNSAAAERGELGLAVLGEYGLLLTLGMFLVAASVWPSRWRSRAYDAADGPGVDPILPPSLI
jgi:hypothetical protein